MSFNKTIKTVFGKLLTPYGYELSEDLESGPGDTVEFSSEKMIFRFVHSRYDRQYGLTIYSISMNLLCNNSILEEFLNIDKVNRNYTSDDDAKQWANLILKYFVEFKDSLLVGDADFLIKLSEFNDNKKRDLKQGGSISKL